ncbi:MAG TPA: DUF4390 domain-containing protein [Burkholderiaceae bacterium]|nr:DUF4390 domain-containing protein [Burkholderiaceae bacterium]
MDRAAPVLFPAAARPETRQSIHVVVWRRLRALMLNCAVALAAASGWGIGAPTALAADRVVVTQAHLAPSSNSEGVALYAQFDFELPFVLEDAINRGIALYFAVDFEMFRSRWYWFDKKVVDQTLTYRLSYSPLTRQYRLGRGALAQPFDSLDEALDTLKRVSGWHVIDKELAQSEADLKGYYAQMRLRLDTAQLPKPFQVAALTHSDWALASDWYALGWAPAVAARVPSSAPPVPSTAP